MFRSQRNFTGWIRECVFLKGLSKKKGKAAIYVIKREGEQQEKEWTRNYI